MPICQFRWRLAADVHDKNRMLAELLVRCGGGDAAAFAQLYRATAPGLASYAHKLVRGWGHGDDVLQESFLAIWLNARHYDGVRAAPLTWLRAIVRNKSVDLYRRRAARIPDAGEAWDADTLGDYYAALPCERIQAEQEQALLARRMGCLGAEQRRAIELTWLHGLSHADAALKMGRPLGTIKTLVRRGLVRLRAQAEGMAMDPR